MQNMRAFRNCAKGAAATSDEPKRDQRTIFTGDVKGAGLPEALTSCFVSIFEHILPRVVDIPPQKFGGRTDEVTSAQPLLSAATLTPECFHHCSR
jgi:hypothetical protein